MSRRAWLWLRRGAIALASLAAVGLLVAWAGIVDIGASSGHWRITSLALHWAMQNSTRTYALFEPEPPADLDAAHRARRAAGHYESDCAFCHGSPLGPPMAVAGQMTPSPPGLAGAAAKWTPRELARIVRHGIKYTAMPAWIAPHRDDEVWSMVAFLRAAPEMSAEDYSAMTHAPALPDDPVLQRCATCHGSDGGSASGAFPVIGGQSGTYLVETLQAFADGARHSGFMQSAVEGLSRAELERLARHYAARPGLSQSGPPGSGEGARIARFGLPEVDVPACESCHGPSERRNPAYPRLAGQDARYIADQLRLMKEGARGGSGYGHVMERIAQRLPEWAIEPVARHYAGDGER